MKLHRLPARLVALAGTVALLISCDSRLPTQVDPTQPDGQTTTTGNTKAPAVTFVRPSPNDKVNVGDSLFVQVDLADDAGVASVTLQGYSERGDSALGTDHSVLRYAPVRAPATGSFPATKLITIKRYLQVLQPIDSTTDSLTVVATVTNITGLTSTARLKVKMTRGPTVKLVLPSDSVNRGDSLVIKIRAVSVAGLKTLGVTVTDSGFPTPISRTLDDTLPVARVAPDTVTLTKTIFIPSNAAGILIISAHATDVNAQSTSVEYRFAIRVGEAPAPLVHQTVGARVELADSVNVTVSGSNLVSVGYKITDPGSGALLDSNSFAASASSFGPQGLPFRLPSASQGRNVRIISFATDNRGKVGYSVPVTVTTPQTVAASATGDLPLVVYGQTFTLPRRGTAGDLTVDTARGNVYVSNTSYNRLERWNASTGAFDPVGVAVGSEPWGMVMQLDNDTLLVANSGGTNISKVCLNPSACGAIGEVLSQRIQTRNTIVQNVTSVRDPATGKIVLSLSAPISYSDRPQYVQQSAGGRLFYSTRPTSYAPAGTIRWLDPKLEVPDPRQVYQYAEKTAPDLNTYAVFNADSMVLIKFPNNPAKSDEIIMYDHIYGKKFGGSCTSLQSNSLTITVPDAICGRDSVVTEAIRKVNIQNGDIEARLDIDINLLGLTDTTFVASSGDRTWIGFGEGNTHGAQGRVMLARDLATDVVPSFFSPGVTVRDFLENASEPVFGMALDAFGSTTAVHGLQSYFGTVESPFHLRLQGKYDTFDVGAGIAFHPQADLRSGMVSSSKSDLTRTAFVASANGSIEVVDAAFYVNRGTLQIKGNLYGPLRASLPFASDNVGIPAGDPRTIVLKLFGLTTNGLVVINLRAQDITPVP